MRDRRDVRRCEALTRKGGRCKSKAMVYHQHQGGVVVGFGSQVVSVQIASLHSSLSQKRPVPTSNLPYIVFMNTGCKSMTNGDNRPLHIIHKMSVNGKFPPTTVIQICG